VRQRYKLTVIVLLLCSLLRFFKLRHFGLQVNNIGLVIVDTIDYRIVVVVVKFSRALLLLSAATASGVFPPFRLRIGQIGAARGGGILIYLHDLIPAFFLLFLDQVTQGVVAGDDVGQKDRPGQRTRTVAGKPALDMCLLITVAIGTGDRVAHDLMADGAHERWW